MSRKLIKSVLITAMALAALGVISPTTHAADEFQCSVNPCRGKLSTDGIGTTAHQVLIIENLPKTESVSLTCESLRGTAEFVSATDISLGWGKGTTDREAYDKCKVDGTEGVVVHMNGCKYTFTAGAAGRTDGAQMHLLCGTGEEVEITIPGTTCIFKIGPQSFGGSAEKGGIGYHTIGVQPNREITVTSNVKNIVIGDSGNCEALIKPGQELTGTLTTGNFLITGQTAAGVMADARFE